jgi:hypothetical protein
VKDLVESQFSDFLKKNFQNRAFLLVGLSPGLVKKLKTFDTSIENKTAFLC